MKTQCNMNFKDIKSEINMYLDSFVNNICEKSISDKVKDVFCKIIITNDKNKISTGNKIYFYVEKYKGYVECEDIGQKLNNLIVSFDKLKSDQIKHIYIESEVDLSMDRVASGLVLTNFTLDQFKSKKNESKINISFVMNKNEKKNFTQIQDEMFAILLCRILSHAPTNKLNIKEYVAIIKDMFKGTDITVEELDPIKHNFTLLQAVGQGSEQKPCMIVLTKGANSDTAIVGKGIMYDSGGLSIKPTHGMDEMYCDMTGSAVCLTSLFALRNDKNVNCRVVLVLAENSVDSRSYRPGDIITSRCGKTVEIGNTDAEGRLALADGVHYACNELGCNNIICVATLVGASFVAFSTEYAACITNNDEFFTFIKNCWNRVGDKVATIPYDPFFEDLLKKNTSRADLSNISSDGAGISTAWLFVYLLAGRKDINFAGICIALYLSRKFRSSNDYHCCCVRAMMEILKEKSK